MNSRTKLLVPVVIVVAVLVAVVVYVSRTTPDADDTTQDPGAGKADGRVSAQDGTDGTDSGPTTGPKTSSVFTVSGKAELEAGVTGGPGFDHISIELTTLSEPAKVLRTKECSVPGDFSFGNVPEGEYTVQAVAEGKWSTRSVHVRVKQKDVSGLTLTLRERGVYSGVILDYNGKPVEGAEVLICYWPCNTYSPILFEESVRRKQGVVVTTDANGRFSGTSPASHCHLFARKPGYTIANTCAGSGGDHEVLRMGAESAVTGTIVSRDGRVVPGALVVLAPKRGFSSSLDRIYDGVGRYIAATNDRGVFRADGLHAGEYQLLAHDPELGISGTAEFDLKTRADKDIGTVKLSPYSVVTGIVVDENDNPVEGAMVHVDYNYDNNSTWMWYTPASLFPGEDEPTAGKRRTEADGRFEILSIIDEKLTLVAEHEDYSDASVDVSPDAKEDVRITLRQKKFAIARIRVIDGTTGEPAKQVTVVGGLDLREMRYMGYVDEEEVTTDDSGMATIKTDKPGRWVFIALGDGLLSGEKTETLEEDTETEIELVLQRASSLTVTVTSGETSLPIPEADVDIDVSDGMRTGVAPLILSAQNIGYDQHETGENGTFRIPVLAEGKYDLSVDAFGYASTSKEIKIKPGENIVSIVLEGVATVEGSVVSPEGQAVPQAEVSLDFTDGRGGSGRNSRYGNHYRDTAYADEEGKFKLESENPGNYTVKASREGHADGKSQPFHVGDKQKVTGILVTMTIGGSISGRILDEEGKPLEGVRVMGTTQSLKRVRMEGMWELRNGPRIETEADGTYKLDALNPGKYSLMTSSDVYLEGTREGVEVVDEMETPNVDFILKEGRKVTGHVADKEGNPIKGVGVTTQRDTSSFGGMSYDDEEQFDTDEDGNFTLTGLGNEKMQVRCHKNGYLAQERDVKPEDTHLEFVLEKAPGIKGKVAKEDGTPVQEFTVNVERTSSSQEERYYYRHYEENHGNGEFHDREDGSFEMEGVPDGEIAVAINAEGFAPKVVGDITLKPAEVRDLGTIHINEGATLRVVVTSAVDKMPVPGAGIRLSDMSSDDDELSYISYMSSSFSRMGNGDLTDDSGVCVLKALNGGKKLVFVEHPDFMESQKEVEVPERGQAELRIELSKGLSFKGVVLSKEDRRPVEGAEITMYASGGYRYGDTSQAVSDATGVFILENLEAGDFRVIVEHRDYATLTENTEVSEEKRSGAFHLTKGGALQVRVVDTQNRPVPGCRVMTYSSAGYDTENETDESGECLFEHLPEGTVRVAAETSGDVFSMKAESVDIVPGQTAELEIVIGGGHALYGTITKNGEAAAEMQVVAAPPQMMMTMEGSVGMDMTGPEGKYRIESLEDGNYMLVITDSGMRGGTMLKSKTFRMSGNDVELNIDVSTGSIAGRVTDESGNPIDGATVQLSKLLDSNDNSLTSVAISMYEGALRGSWRQNADKDGKFRFEDVGKGEFRVTAESSGYGTAVKSINKAEQEEVVGFNLVLSSGYSISGKITNADGEAMDQAWILAMDGSGNTVQSSRSTTENEGDYTLTGLANGRYELLVAAKGQAPQKKSVVVSNEDSTGVDFVLGEGKKLVIKVKDAMGQPISGAVAMFVSRDSAKTMMFNQLHSSGDGMMLSAPSPSDADGVIEIGDLGLDEYEFLVVKGSYAAKKLTVKMANEDRTESVTLQEE